MIIKQLVKKNMLRPKERAADFEKWQSPALFLSAATNAHGDGRLNPRVINTVFNEVCSLAGVEGHTPHDTRHAMAGSSLRKPAISPRFKGSSATPTQPIASSTPGSPTRSWLRCWKRQERFDRLDNEPKLRFW